MDPLTIAASLSAALTALEALKKIKQLLYDDSKFNKAKSNSENQALENKEIIKGLFEQVESCKAIIEKHNDVLIGLSLAIQEREKESKKLRILSYSAIIVSLISASLCVVIAFK